MRADNAHQPATARFRPAFDALGDWVRRGGVRLRWLLGGAAALAVIAAGALFYAASDSSSSEWLYDGRVFPRTESARIVAALKGAEIPCVESAGKVGVPAARRAEALDVLAKARIGPRPIDDLLDDRATGGSIWELPDDRERRDLRGKEKIAREVIARFGGVVSATVILTPVQSGNRLNPVRSLKATALIQTEDNQPLPHATVDRICHVLTNIDAVDPDAITVIDPTNGYDYRFAGRPDVEARSTVRLREEELRDKIAHQLRIEGALVYVRIDPSGPAPARDESAAPDSEPSARLGVNRSIVTDEGRERPDETSTATPRLLVNATSAVPRRGAGPGSPRGSELPGLAYVLVQVPRSHYLKLFQAIHPAQTPTPEELAPFALRVKETIQTVVGAILPASEMAALNIVRIDDLQSGPPAAIDGLSAGKPAGGWLPVLGGVGLTVLVLAAAGGGWLAVRRPTLLGGDLAMRRPRLAPLSAAATAGPGERVRELIRLDPGAAAGVLHRWIAQGGHVR
jgi:hypothetical protein